MKVVAVLVVFFVVPLAALSLPANPIRRNVGGVALAARQADVPSPADVGSDGFPQLPSVDFMLNPATETMQSISEQASSLQQRVVEVQQDKVARLTKQKEVFEKKLKSQEEENRQLVVQNKEITGEIAKLRTQNADIRNHSHKLQDGNRLMRSELTVLASRLDAAKNDVSESLGETDDSQAPELNVLGEQDLTLQSVQVKRQRVEAMKAVQARVAPEDPNDASIVDNQKDEADADEDSREEDEGASFLAIESRVRNSTSTKKNPNDMLRVLSQNVEALTVQEHQSENQLKDLFFKDFQVGASRHSALVAQQTDLNSTRASLFAMRARLKAAEGKLETTEGQLKKRLRQLGLFVQRLGHLATAPESEVPSLLTSMPKTVPQGDK